LHGWYPQPETRRDPCAGRFIGERSPEHVQWCGEIRNVPFKRCEKNSITYLEKEEIDASWKSRTEAQGWAQRLCALALPLQLRCQGQRGSPCGDRRSGVEPRRNRISETPRKRRKVRFCHGSPDRCSNKSARRTTNQCATPQIRTQYTILEHSVPSRMP